MLAKPWRHLDPNFNSAIQGGGAAAEYAIAAVPVFIIPESFV